MKNSLLLLFLVASAALSQTLVAHSVGRSLTASGTATTGTLNGSSCTSGCIIAACVGTYGHDPASATVTASGVTGGTWAHGITYDTTTHGYTSLWYLSGITSISSTATVSASLPGGYAQVAAAVFSGAAISPALDQQTGAATGSTDPRAPGSLTPAGNNEIGISCLTVQATGGAPGLASGSTSGYAIADRIACSSGVTNCNDPDSTVNLGTWLAYVFQSSASTANPSWDLSISPGNIGGLTGGGVSQTFFFSAADAPVSTQIQHRVVSQ